MHIETNLVLTKREKQSRAQREVQHAFVKSPKVATFTTADGRAFHTGLS